MGAPTLNCHFGGVVITVNSLELIGAVGARILAEELDKSLSNAQAGIARYLLDRLQKDQTIAIVHAVINDKELSSKVFVAIPANVAEGTDLPARVVTGERNATYFRNREPPNGEQALLVVNIDDIQNVSLGDMTRIGSKMLTDRMDLWVDIAAKDLVLPETSKEVWKAALKGLTDAHVFTVGQLAKYISATRARIQEEGQPLQSTLGYCLPILRVPRDSTLAIAEQQQRHRSAWKKKFEQMVHERAPLLRKQTKSRQILEREELAQQFRKVRDEIPSEHWGVIEAFIDAPQTWNAEAQALAELEWETDRIDGLFTGLKTKKVSLARETLDFYMDKDDGLLDKKDRDYLELLLATTKKQPGDDDREFYENHRSLIAERPALKAKWDRFVFGAPIECTDLLVGLLSALHRLKAQAPNWSGDKRLVIEWNARGRTQHLGLNADVARLFDLRYKGLENLFGPRVEWNLDPLFKYEAFIDAEKASPRKYQSNQSTARAALRIRLDLHLKIGEDFHSVQVDYLGKPDAVSASLPDDLSRLVKKPFADLSVQRVRTSKKGQAQRIALGDSGSFEAAYNRDAGSFVPALRDISTLEGKWRESLDRCQQRMDEEEFTGIAEAWDAFQSKYTAAIADFESAGIASDSLLDQARDYAVLLERLEARAGDDIIRRELLDPLLRLGVIRVEDDPAAAIVAPWNPMRMVSIAVKSRSVGRLFQHMLGSDEIEVGDERLFFEELCKEARHPYYPEIAVGYSKGDPTLLVVSETLDDYSLMEQPVNAAGVAKTSEDPQEGAHRVREIVGRYLDLQPHENASLSVALFECDSAGLPLAAVEALTTLQESEIHCNVTLRHRDRRSLQRVYNDLLEQSDADPDAPVASETSRNFMAKLRVGIRIDPPGRTADDCRQVDIAYLQDVVARRARVQWPQLPIVPTTASILTHVPPRWAYKAPTTSESAVRYLTCPEQPFEGLAYVGAVAAVVERQASARGHRRLPMRTISLNDGSVRQVFDEAHALAEWVVNYDDLLDPEQLRHQNVRVIRYQKDRSNGRNVVVSSTSRSRVLEVLLRRRLEELGLGLTREKTDELIAKLIGAATDISGEIVLRASKRGTAAGELIGIVLSAALVREEFGAAPVACFFLDDYAAWLGQSESGIADLLFISFDPTEPSKIRVVVTEAKYVGSASVSDASKKSRRQVEATVGRINDALFENPGRLDRDLWLSRLSDLLLDAVKSPRHERIFDEVRRLIRQATVQIDLRGYSHVFATDGNADVASDQESLPEKCGPHSLQEVFNHNRTKDLLRGLVESSKLSTVRTELGDEKPWIERTWRTPAARPRWMEPNELAGESLKIKPVEPVEQKPKRRAKVAIAEVEAVAEPVPMPYSETAKPVEIVQSGPIKTAKEVSVSSLIASKAVGDVSDATAIAWLEAAAKTLQRALVGWQLQAKVLGTRLTPNAGLIRLLGSDRLEAKDIENNRQRLLTTHSLNVLSISPRPGEIVVAVERPNRRIVPMWDVWGRVPTRESGVVNLSFIIGVRELDGEVQYLNLGQPFGGQQSHAPHTLIAGTTGSGKSILIQNLLIDIALTNPPSLAKIYCIDPKMGVDYGALEGLPHLVEGIIVEQDRAIIVLEQLIIEMDERYRRFASMKVPNLHAFNERVTAKERLPAIFVVHDEFAEWMLTDEYKDSVSSTVKRLGVKARAAGIHLFFAAQRPDKDVLPPQLRDNLGNRLILRVEGEGTSEIALGQKGAERLLGKGHCAARLQNESDLIYIQVPWLSGSDAEELVTAIKASHLS
jgi:DNA segregation ATPase FtsK/SpoIIIE, S-DNA-T family